MNVSKAFCLEHLVFGWIVAVFFQHSAPYRWTFNTLLLKILVLVWTLILVVLHTSFSIGVSLVGFTDPGVDFLVTVTGCCHFGAQLC